ncbi:site-2 protease family protein [Corallococcus interemptor]|uniref:site-2 protease family protein n=1 Tax=Corallococcus interemptor TaxID=2316720 RepID=UPI003D011C2F
MVRLSLIFWLWLLCFGITVVWTLVQALVAWALGARPVSVVLGYGPTLVKCHIGGIRCSFRPIPGGGAVDFKDRTEGAASPDSLLQLSAPRYAAAVLLPWVVQVTIGMACLGSSKALHQFASGFAMPFELFLLRDRVERFFALIQHGERVTALGLLSVKMAAVNLLPLPFFAGGALLFLPWRKARPEWVEKLALISLAAFVSWALYVSYLVITTLF